jgi:FkbM family methyltransferase
MVAVTKIAEKTKRALGRVASLPLSGLGIAARSREIERLNEDSVISIDTARGAIKFLCLSPLVTSRATTLLTKEPDTVEWIDSFAKDGVFWDVGANVGVYSLYAALSPDVTVISFEPLAANFHALSRNLLLNDTCDRVSAYCVALSNATQLGVLNTSSVKIGSALTHFGQLGEMSPYCDKETICLPQGMIGFTIDDFIHQFHPPFPTYLKLDVDGLEWKILQGARNSLHDLRLRSVMVELSMSNEPEQRSAISYLQDCGFALKSVGSPQATTAGVGANHLFIRVE